MIKSSSSLNKPVPSDECHNCLLLTHTHANTSNLRKFSMMRFVFYFTHTHTHTHTHDLWPYYELRLTHTPHNFSGSCDASWRHQRSVIEIRVQKIINNFIYSVFQLLTHNILTCHTISETWHSNARNTNLQHHTLILSLRLSFQFHKTLFANDTHNTQFSMKHTNLTGSTIKQLSKHHSSSLEPHTHTHTHTSEMDHRSFEECEFVNSLSAD